jgi:hypothetical protein
MANAQVSSQHGFTERRRGRAFTGSDPNAEAANMGQISAMRTRLAAINGTYYTAARLDAMTENDMVYALRDTPSI